MVDTLTELIKRWLYVRLVGTVRSLTGVRVHYRAVYSHDYMYGARWYMLRNLRLMIDGHRCTYVGTDGRCTALRGLDVHHTTYLRAENPGIGGMLAELSDLRTLCRKHHNAQHHDKES